MLATQAMSVDTTRQDFYPNIDRTLQILALLVYLRNRLLTKNNVMLFIDLYHRPGLDCRLWPDVSPFGIDSRATQSLYSQFELANQMNFHANMIPEFSTSQAPFLQSQTFQQGQQWAAKEMCPPQAQSGSYSSPLQPQPPQTFEKTDNDQQMGGMDKPNQTLHSGQTSPDTLMHGQPSQFRSFPVGHLRHQSSVDFGEDLLRNSHDTVNENIFAEWCWGAGQRPENRPVHEGSVHWGTDSSFASPRGSAASVSSDAINPRSFPHLKVSEQRESVPRDPTLLPRGYSHDFYKLKAGLSASLGDHPITWPVLRTRTNPMDRDVLSTYRALSLEYLGSALHEQKSLATVGPRREKLTEEQKRRNHILHEQKRRAMIKDGFDDLLNLVPDLKDRGLSKSAILVKAAEWLGTLTCGNKALRAQARGLEGGADSTSSTKFVASRQQKSYRRSSRRS